MNQIPDWPSESCLALSTWTEKNAGRSPHFVDFHLTFTTSTE